MINLPNTLAKGENLTFALNKSLVIAAVSDSYWSDSANISKCIVVYKSTSGHQRKRLEFDFSQESPTVVAEWSVKARNAFEIEEIVLIDFDSGSYTVPRSALPSGKGISFAGEGGGGGSVVTEVVHNYMPNGAINDMVADGNDLYIGGAFSALRYMAPYAATISAATGENVLTDQVSGKFPIFDGAINCFAFDGNDILYVGGAFTTVNGFSRPAFAKLVRVNGVWESDQSWNSTKFLYHATGGAVSVTSMRVDGDNLYLGGLFYQYRPGANVSTGQIISPHFVGFNKNTGEFVCTVVPNIAWATGKTATSIVQDGQSLYLGFNASTSPQKIDKLTGAVDPGFACTLTFVGSSPFTVLALSGDALYVGGAFTAVNGSAKFSLAKVSKTTGAVDSSFTAPWTSSATTNYVRTLAINGSEIFAGGVFNDDTNLRRNLVKLNSSTGARIVEFNPGYTFFRYGQTSSVNSMVISGGSLFAVGRFDGRSVVGDPQTCINIAKVNPTTGAIDSSFASNGSLIDPATEFVNAAVIDGSNIIIGGSFSGYGGYSRQGVAKLNKDSFGNWKVDETFDSSSGATGLVWTLLKDGEWLYVGGDITAYAEQTRNRVARLNATTGALDSSFGVGVFTTGQTTGQFNGVLGSAPVAGTGVVNRIAKNGSLIYIAGSFTTYSKKNSSGAAASVAAGGRWIIVDPATNTETVPANGANNHIYEMIVDGNSVYFGGNFTSWGGVTRNHLVKVNSTDFAVDSAFTSPVNSNAFVDLLSLVNGELWAGVQGSSSLIRVNKTTGALLNSYAISTVGGTNIRVRGGIFEDSTYVYVLMSRISSTYFQEIRRISKATNTIDSSWGYKTTGNNNVWMSAVMVGDEFIVGGFPNSTTTAFNLTYKKDLWIIDKATAAEKFNI